MNSREFSAAMATRAAKDFLTHYGQVFFGGTWQCARVEASKAFLEKCVPATLPQVCVQRGESLHLNLTREGSCFLTGSQ